MKIYEVNGRLAWYNEGEQPKGAKEYEPKKAETSVKDVKPENKSRKVSKK